MLVYFIRHGQTAYNAKRLFQGVLDIPLNDTGREQARLIAERFCSVPLARIYHSPLARAACTAQILAECSPAELVCVPELREISMGAWEGLSFDMAQAQMPEACARYLHDRKHESAPGGESLKALQARALAAMQPLLERETQDFAVVAHGAVFKALLCAYLHIDLTHLDCFDISNASVSVVQFHEGQAKVITLNDRSHFPAPYQDFSRNQAVL